MNNDNEWGFEPKRNWEGEKEPARKILAYEPANDGGPFGDSNHAGVPVDGTNFPKRVRWAYKRRKPAPDFDSIPHLSVSEEANQVIDGLQPGVHQFFPVEYQNTKGEFTAIRYWFVLCDRIDSVNRELTNLVLRDGLEWRRAKDLVRRGEPIPSRINPSEPARLVFTLSAIRDRHL